MQIAMFCSLLLTPKEHGKCHFSVKRIILFSLRWAAEPMDVVQPMNHPHGGSGLAVGRAFGGLQHLVFKRILKWEMFLFSWKII